MNDEQIIERVRTAVDAQVADVRSTPPPLGEPSYATSQRPRRRWVLPAALAAAAAIVLGVVAIARDGDDRANVDRTAPTSVVVAPASDLERWVLDLPGAELVSVGEFILNHPAGTNVYYVGEDGASGAVVRTNGSSIALSRSSWPNVEEVTELGAPATLYSDDDQQLLVVDGDPPYIVESYGAMSARALASSSRFEDGVVTAGGGAVEVGRSSADGAGALNTAMTYRYGDETILMSVFAHPGGLVGYLLDSGLAPGESRVDARGQRWLTFGSLAVSDSPTGDVVTIKLDDESELAVPGAGSSAHEVDEATWQALVAPVLGVGPPISTVVENPQVYRAVGTVIEVPGDGVKLCLGAVRESLPPQCDGIPVDPVTWRWPDGTFQESNGTRWGEYVVDGLYDGTTFIPKNDARLATSTDRRTVVKGSTATRCAEPESGWHAAAENSPVGTDGESTLAGVQAYLESQPDYGGMWIDDSITLPTDRQARYVVNAMFTGDVERHRAELEAIWPGALCVVQTDTKPVDELVGIQNEVSQMSSALSVLIDDPNGTVIAMFVLVTPELQAQLDARYGTGTVVPTSALVPVP